jgi:hypothetical protein
VDIGWRDASLLAALRPSDRRLHHRPRRFFNMPCITPVGVTTFAVLSWQSYSKQRARGGAIAA